MKLFIHTFLTAVLASQFAFTASRAQADSVPEILHYKFSGTGTNVPNLASAPPSGTTTATINGGLTQTGTDLNFGGGGFSLVGSGVSSTTDYLNTGWAPNLGPARGRSPSFPPISPLRAHSFISLATPALRASAVSPMGWPEQITGFCGAAGSRMCCSPEERLW